MRLLLLLSFLGFRPVFSSGQANPTSTSLIPQGNETNSTDDKQSTSKGITTVIPAMSTETTQAKAINYTSVTSTGILESTKLFNASIQATLPSTSQAAETGTSTTVERMTSSSNVASTASVTSSQKMSSTKATSATESNTSQNGSTFPKATTKSTSGDSRLPETSTASSVQISVSTQTQVVTTTDFMMGNKTSGTRNDTQNSTADGTGSGKTNTEESYEDGLISLEVKCKKEHSKGAAKVAVPKNFSCENFVEKHGKELAKSCSTLDFEYQKKFDKCEIWLNSVEDQLFVEVYYRANDKINKILTDLKSRIDDSTKKYAGGIQSTQEKLTQFRGEHTGSLQTEAHNDSMELKKVIALAVTGSLLLLIFLSGVVYRCSQYKSKHKDPYLTEELRTVDNGCHDNPAMDVTERDSEMEEKNYCKATFLENTDGWIVPMDTHIKDELEEEDTHL
ncbi:podocalyxin isoform X1 [Hypanus sabinus]|uniref:podocalyxin isoform X1 n=1 Tax=Hypanus sabinus TaxID=79690 RepID=UPI0028C46DF5|nr:podocalyxin isoform X1 [Hypanus sabinus]